MRGMLTLIIISSILIHDVVGRTRSKRDNDEEGEEIEEEKGEEGDQYCACAAPAPAGTAYLRHSFTDMPLLFEHVMALLQRDPAALEQSSLTEASTIQKRDTSQRRSRRPTRREARHAPTPENFERLLSQVETQLAEHDKNRSRNSKRKRESPVTMGNDKNTELTKSQRGNKESKRNSDMKPKTKSNDRVSRNGREDMNGPKSRMEKRSEDEEEEDVGDSDKDLVKDQAHSGAREPPSREDNSDQARANSGSTNRKSEEEMHDPKIRIVKRSEDEEEEDVGDEDTDLVKDQVHSGAQEPPSREDNSRQARADSDGGGGQQVIMGTFQAMIMPMSGPAQAISGLMPSG